MVKWYPPQLLSRTNIQAAVFGLLVFVTYYITCAPGLMYTDSGELASACVTLGVAHPTGYPLFTVLGHVWTMMAWGSPIAALNVLAALWVASAVAIAFLLIREVLAWVYDEGQNQLHIIIAAASALLFGWSATVWAQATSIEVYSLHILLCCITLLFVVRSVKDIGNAQRWTVLAGLFYGLMLANHLSSAFLAPGIILIWLSGTGNAKDRIRTWPYVVVPALAGVALYIVLPIRSAQEPPINWGMVHRDLSAFLYHVRGTQFGVWLFSDKKAFSTNSSLFWKLLTTMFLWFGLIPIVVGAWRTLGAKRRLALGLTALVIGNLGISLGYAIPDLDSYFLPTFLVATIFFSVGLVWLMRKAPSKAQWAAFVFPIVLLWIGWPVQDKSKQTAVSDYTRWVFDNAEPNAIIITRQWDFFCSAAWYLQTVDQLRTDVTVIDKELLRRTWYAPWLLQRYPSVMKNVQGEVDAFMPYLDEFESNAEAFNKNRRSVQLIQQRFVELLNALLKNNPNNPVYVTPELLNEEAGFAVGYTRLPAGPLVRLVMDTVGLRQRQGLAGASELVASLAGRNERLDLGLKQTTLSGLGTMAMYRLDAFSDTAGFRRYRDLARRLDKRDAITRQLDGIVE
ncbi:MAG: DUF2723 domain-containing protein [Candidatus Kapabacteria bacterium]|nr:DUF2723 domain-containing protein [Candidatus Kapabacteria bacterium]